MDEMQVTDGTPEKGLRARLLTAPLRECEGEDGRAPALLQRGDEPVEQQSSHTDTSSVVRDKHGDLGNAR
jgi:hypothetical protein